MFDLEHLEHPVAAVSSAALRHNIARLDEALARSGHPDTRQLAVVKAGGYGHGSALVADVALKSGVVWLGVAQLDEALTLRKELKHMGYRLPGPAADKDPTAATPERPRLLSWIFSPHAHDALREALNWDIDLSVSALWALDAVRYAARTSGWTARVHLKIDTGMGRAGATVADFPALLEAALAAQDTGEIELVGLWSHLARGDDPGQDGLAATAKQLEIFKWAAAQYDFPIRHLGATSGELFHPETDFELVRSGISMYGLTPNPDAGSSADLDLIPAMTLAAPLTSVKRVPAGTPVSYGGTWVADTERWLAVVPLGYGDGIPRTVSGRAEIWVKGHRYPQVGRVCMDQVVIDLGSAADAAPAPVAPGDTAILFGSGTRGEPTADEWAVWAETINYEIVTRIGARVPRVQID